MQHFLKPATGAAGAWIVAPQFLHQLFVAVDNAHPALDFGLRREASAALAGLLVKSTLRRIVVSLP
jgi:hypothetical protein